MKKLLIYFKNYIKESILGPFFKLLEASFELFVPIVVAKIIDNGIANGDKVYIMKMCLLLITLGIMGLCFSITAQYFAAKASVGFVKELKHALFSHIQGLSFSEIDTLGTSTMVTRMTSDMNQVQSGINLTLRLLLRSPFVVFGAMIMAFTIDAKAALIFVVAIPVLSAVVFGIMLICIPLYKKVQARLDKVLGITRENLAGSRVIRAFCKEEVEISEFEKRNEELTVLQKYVGGISVLMSPVTFVIINLAIISLIWTGAIRVQAGLITQGAVVALYNYMSQILVELIKLASLIISITKSVACGNRISSIFDIHSSLVLKEITPEACSSPNVVEFHHVNLCYKNAGEDSLTDIDFAVKKGETIGIIGGTGSGKSSLVNMIPRFYDASSGSVLVDGMNVKDYKIEALRDKIGVVLQKAVFFKGTIKENILWGKKDAEDNEIYEALEVSQAKEIVEGKEGGLDYVIEQGSKNLSGGQLQRLTIARALVKKPEILILDDSSSALDFATDANLRQSLRKMKYKPTVFIVSQRAASIQFTDRIIVLDDGKIAGIGKHEDLLSTCSVYSEIYHSQFKKEGE
ncbi:MAG: ABC transporter ATP-binding protein/permease [Bacillota bacterium]|nr:ABC transporter ATP-binding protein/permease [Bacillota bacterium]